MKKRLTGRGGSLMGFVTDRILLLRLSSIGDVIHAIPAFQALREALPEAEIGWAVEPAAAPLVHRLPGLDHVHELDIQCWRDALFSPATWRAGRAALREIKECNYDIALDLQGLWKSALVARLSGAYTLGMATSDLRERGARHLYHAQADATAAQAHVTERGMRLAAAACPGVSGQARWPKIYNDADARAVKQGLATLSAPRPVLIHSAANWSSKQYPEPRWAAVGRGINDATGLSVLWLWGPGERDRAVRLAELAGHGNQACFQTELPELAALMGQAAVVIGGDSAPLHLAVACGAPVVALFGPTDPARLGPLDPADHIVVRRLECSHCHRRTCPLGTNECLDSIGPDEIVRAAIARLESREGVER